MGFLTTVLMVTLPATSYATFLAFRLGNQLPVACRNFGRNIGMGYNYFKVVLRLLAPETEKPAEIFDLIRKSEQQDGLLTVSLFVCVSKSIALTREIKEGFLRARQDVKNILPEELQKNPMNILRIQPDKPLENPTGEITGAKLMDVTLRERRRIVERKKEKKADSSFSNSL